jgi:hypothetical protein
VFALLDPSAFEACFRTWVEAIPEVIPGEVIAVDGKTLRRSHDRGYRLGALPLVSAWAGSNRVVLGQVATEAKSNEITAIPRLLELLQIEGFIVTLDAMGCQVKIAALIRARGAHYVLALKGNQERLAEEVQKAFIDADARDYAGAISEVVETTDIGLEFVPVDTGGGDVGRGQFYMLLRKADRPGLGQTRRSGSVA